MAGNIARFDQDGLRVGNSQLTTTGGDVGVGKNLFVAGDVIVGGAVRGVAMDGFTIINGRPPAVIDVLLSQSGTFYTDYTLSHMTLNVITNGKLAVGNSTYFAIILINAAIGYLISNVSIDSSTSNVNLRWSSGVAPTSGSAAGFDYYSFQVLNTGSTYYVFATVTKY
jgi:hypothetical protein